MITWIASYPRSGNTLLRMMLQRVFELPSYSKYDDKIFLEPGDNAFSAIGHQSMEAEWGEFYRHKLQAAEMHLIKTHEPPLDEEPAIYVVRNGMAAVDSYQHFYRTFDQKNCSLEELILGTRGPYPSWGAHLDAWNPRQRPRTLILEYHELLGNPERCLDLIAAFLDRNRQGSWTNNFESLQAANPDFFRRGRVEPDPARYTPELKELFDLIHGDWMSEFGYSTTKVSRHQFCRSIRAAVQSADAAQNSLEALAAARHEAMIQSTAATTRLDEMLQKDREIQNLKRTCDERGELIKHLSAQLASSRAD